jgi:hypothetical protein
VAVRSFIFICVFALLSPASVRADDVEDALRLARGGEGMIAVQSLKPLAERGSTTAQYALGLIYANGDGVPADYSVAARWFDAATKTGNAEARRHLAFMRQVGLIATPAAAADSPRSGFRVQVASVNAEDDAPREWRRLQRRYPEILERLDMALVPFDAADGARLYRIQAGPLDEEAARSTCAKLRAEGSGCLVVTP